MMSKSTYIKFATMFKEQREDILEHYSGHMLCHYSTWATIVGKTADIFAADNPRFDRSRFLKACGIEEGE